MFKRLETVAAFENPQQAHIARGRLITEGMEAFLWDEHLIAANWLYSNAVRGVKVKVWEHHLDEAVELLEDRYERLLLEQMESDEEHTCTRCGSRSITSYDPLRVLAALTLIPFWPIALLLGLPLIKWSARSRCLTCNAMQ